MERNMELADLKLNEEVIAEAANEAVEEEFDFLTEWNKIWED